LTLDFRTKAVTTKRDVTILKADAELARAAASKEGLFRSSKRSITEEARKKAVFAKELLEK